MSGRTERTLPQRASLFVVGLTAVLLVVDACASNPHTPPGWLAEAEEAVRDPWGAWVIVDETRSRRVVGELIAVHRDSIFLLPESGRFTELARDDVVRAVVVKYRPRTLWPWFLLGSAATVSNGYFLIFTAPMWTVGGILSVRSDNQASRLEIPPTTWEEAASYARFPQSLPPGLNRDRLRPKPRR